MNAFLSELFESIALDSDYLNSYLSESEQQYLGESIGSRADFENEFYTDGHGENLETLLHFLHCHKQEILQILDNQSKKEILISLYTSRTISGGYNCIRFDLDKFDKTYKATGEIRTVYRVGRNDETANSLGNSWSTSHSGLKCYSLSSGICAISRTVFEAQVNDSEILCEILSQEDELVLKKKFAVIRCRELSYEEKVAIFT